MMPNHDYKSLPRLALLTLSLLLVSGCAGLDAGRELISGLTDSIFGDEDNADPPAILAEYTAEIEIDQLWKESIGDGTDQQYLKLIPAVNSDTVFAAARNGRLEALKSLNGDSVWSINSDFPFSAGPGVSGKSVVMGCISGEVVNFDRFTGEQRWKVTVPSEVQAAPAIADGVVVIRTTDGKIIGLRESDGGQIWVVEQSVPALSIRGASVPLIVGDSVMVGAANGKLQALQLKDGKSLWEATIAMPSGRSEVERLVDLDADPIENQSTIFVSSFQGGTSAVAKADGDVLWRNEEVSSYSGLSADRRYLYVSDSHGEVWQLDQRSGAALWRQKDLHNRRLSTAAVYQNYLVAGDFEGYVHWLSINDGRQLGRIQVSKAAIEAKPVVVDGIVYIYAKDGTLAALKVK